MNDRIEWRSNILGSFQLIDETNYSVFLSFSPFVGFENSYGQKTVDFVNASPYNPIKQLQNFVSSLKWEFIMRRVFRDPLKVGYYFFEDPNHPDRFFHGQRYDPNVEYRPIYYIDPMDKRRPALPADPLDDPEEFVPRFIFEIPDRPGQIKCYDPETGEVTIRRGHIPRTYRDTATLRRNAKLAVRDSVMRIQYEYSRMGHRLESKIFGKMLRAQIRDIKYTAKFHPVSGAGEIVGNLAITGVGLGASTGATAAATNPVTGVVALPVLLPALAAIAAGVFLVKDLNTNLWRGIRNHWRRNQHYLKNYRVMEAMENQTRIEVLETEAADAVRRAWLHYQYSQERMADLHRKFNEAKLEFDRGNITCDVLFKLVRACAKFVHENIKLENYILPCIDLLSLLIQGYIGMCEKVEGDVKLSIDNAFAILADPQSTHTNCNNYCYTTSPARRHIRADQYKNDFIQGEDILIGGLANRAKLGPLLEKLIELRKEIENGSARHFRTSSNPPIPMGGREHDEYSGIAYFYRDAFNIYNEGVPLSGLRHFKNRIRNVYRMATPTERVTFVANKVVGLLLAATSSVASGAAGAGWTDLARQGASAGLISVGKQAFSVGKSGASTVAGAVTGLIVPAGVQMAEEAHYHNPDHRDSVTLSKETFTRAVRHLLLSNSRPLDLDWDPITRLDPFRNFRNADCRRMMWKLGDCVGVPIHHLAKSKSALGECLAYVCSLGEHLSEARELEQLIWPEIDNLVHEMSKLEPPDYHLNCRNHCLNPPWSLRNRLRGIQEGWFVG